MTIPMRKARPKDADAITALVHAAYTPWVEIIGATPGPMLDDYGQRIAQDWVAVTEDHHGLRTVLILIDQGDALLIDNLAVRPDLQGKGQGRRLLEAAEVNGRMSGFKCTRLYAHEKMTANISLYERTGYAITHRVIEHGLNRIYMEKALAPWPGGPRRR